MSDAPAAPASEPPVVAAIPAIPLAEPPDPRAAKARLVLETHCARCHQNSMLRRPAPASDFGDILELDRIAADPALVVPGNADASRLYTLVLRGEMPFDISNDLSKDEGPTSSEVEALRDWIEALPPPATGCGQRTRIKPQTVVQDMVRVIAADSGEASGLRFVSLAHLYNTCASAAAMQGYAQAVTKLANSLSSAPRPAKLDAIGEAGAILKIRLADLGWSAATWDRLSAGNPLTLVAGLALPEEIARRIGTPSPIVPADWLAATATRPQVYHDILGHAASLDDQLGKHGIDRAKPDTANPPRRIGLRTSAVTRGHRLIELHRRPTGGVWLAYDFAGSDGRRDIFANPTGPIAENAAAPPFKPDAVRLMASLPNGFLAYAVYGADGQRLEAVPSEIEAANQGRKRPTTAADCLSCHDSGPRRAFDELREAASAPTSALPKSVRDAVQALHPPAGELSQVFATESQRYREALLAAGIDPDLRLDGIEIVAALARAYSGHVTLERAAEEIGEAPAEFLARLDGAQGEAALTAARLKQGAIPRAEAMRLLAALTVPGGKSEQPRESQITHDLALVADKTRYALGELARFTIRSSFDCNLTLISVNVAGKATVIFPNDFEPDNGLVAGRELRVPADTSPYQLRLAQSGRERVIGICMAQSKMADAIRQNYEQQRFTALGDWRNFLRALRDDEDPEPGKSDKTDGRAKAKSTSGRSRTKEAEPPKRIRHEPQARAAIDLHVEAVR